MLTTKCVAQLRDYNKTNTYDHDLHKHIEAKQKITKSLNTFRKMVGRNKIGQNKLFSKTFFTQFM
jgi:hypothetical protein